MKNTYSVPPSKSISNRALVMAFLKRGKSVVKNVLKSDDTDVMVEAYRKLGFDIKIHEVSDSAFDIEVDSSEITVGEAEFFMNNAGTATRFMIPALCVTEGIWTVTGNERMLERPIKDLVDALIPLGANIEYLGEEGYLPLKIVGGSLSGSTKVKGDISSQYLSGLMITNAFLDKNFEVEVEGELVSKPYVDLTESVIRDFMAGDQYQVEGDASSASYFWALGAIDGPVTVDNVPLNTKQADIKLLGALEKLGANVDDTTVSPGKLNGIEIDCIEFPDSAMTLAVLCAVAKGKSRLTGLHNLKFKECDRLAALETELRKLGVNVMAFDDGLEIVGSEKLSPAQIETYDDHRMAMCFAVLKYIEPEIEILDPGCVSKTFPTFWYVFPV